MHYATLPETLSPCPVEMTPNCLSGSFFNAILIINYTGDYVVGFILYDLRIRTHGEARGIRDLKGMLLNYIIPDLSTLSPVGIKFVHRFSLHPIDF